MAFDMVICWIAAGVAVSVLTMMGVQNKRSGYRRQREDTPAENLFLWAAIAASKAPKETARPFVPSYEDQSSADLVALSAFTGLAQNAVPKEPVVPVVNSLLEPAVTTTSGNRRHD